MVKYIFDLILLAILALNIIFYGLRGFFKSLWRLLSSLLSLFLAACFGGIAGDALIKPALEKEITDTKILDLTSDILGYLAVFVVSALVLFILGFFIDRIKDALDMKKLDAALGALFGFFIGLVMVFVTCLIVSVLVELNLSGFIGEKIKALKDLAENSYIFRFFCQIAPFDYVHITKLVGEGIDKAKELITAAESVAEELLPGTGE